MFVYVMRCSQGICFCTHTETLIRDETGEQHIILNVTYFDVRHHDNSRAHGEPSKQKAMWSRTTKQPTTNT